jgi:hypothetical protein
MTKGFFHIYCVQGAGFGSVFFRDFQKIFGGVSHPEALDRYGFFIYNKGIA